MSEIGFGTAPLAFRDIPEDQAVATIHAALDHGVRLIDTALAYTRPGVESYAESVVARAVAGWDGVSTQRVRLAWLLARAPGVLPLVGATRPASIVDSFAAPALRLADGDLALLDRG